MDDPRELRLAGARRAGEEDRDLARRSGGDVAQDPSDRLASPRERLELERRAVRARRVVGVELTPLEEKPIGERRKVAREELGARAVVLRERPRVRPLLEVEDTERRVEADGRAEHGLDAVRLHALAAVEARVVDRGRAHDRAARRERLGDDAA